VSKFSPDIHITTDEVSIESCAFCPGCGERMRCVFDVKTPGKNGTLEDAVLLPSHTACSIDGSCVWSLGDETAVEEYLANAGDHLSDDVITVLREMLDGLSAECLEEADKFAFDFATRFAEDRGATVE